MISSFIHWLVALVRRPILGIAAALLLLLLLAAVGRLAYSLWGMVTDPRNLSFASWAGGDADERSELITSQAENCPGAPFILPAEGYIGLLYGDPRGPYSRSRPHQGIDIFSDSEAGVTPVFAAYDGYITREPGWRSTLIMRVPEDPLGHQRQIWLYYTHMADREGRDFIEARFAPGTSEQFVEQGSLLGYSGNYNGSSARTVWVHLHFSIVLDDGDGSYLNELQFNNTIDPSPYLGMNVSYQCDEAGSGCDTIPRCLGEVALPRSDHLSEG